MRVDLLGVSGEALFPAKSEEVRVREEEGFGCEGRRAVKRGRLKVLDGEGDDDVGDDDEYLMERHMWKE